MLKNNTNNKQAFELNHQVKSDSAREKMFNCNLKVMDNILFNRTSEQNDNEDDETTNTNEKDETEFNNKQLKVKANKQIDYLTKLELVNSKYKHDDIIDDQLDDDDEEERHHNEMIKSDHLKKNDYLQMAMYYKNLCKSYKKQLIESHKTIRELHLTIEVMERKNWIHKQQKNNLQLMKFESEENMKLTIEKCRVYCDKINRLTNLTEEDSFVEQTNNSNNSEEFILNTLRHTLQEKKDIKSFSKSFNTLITYINPNSKEIDSVKKLNKINYTNLKSVINETLDYIKENSPKNFHCKCNGAYEFEKQYTNPTKITPTLKYIDNKKELCLISTASPSSSSSSSCSVSSYSSSYNSSSNYLHNHHHHHHSIDYYKHQPSLEFLYKCINLVQDLFDVDCFQNIPTKLNDVYYKLGQLINFKKAIQNIFDPNENYTIEKLVCAVQTIHSQLNDQISNNLSNLLHSTNLQKVVDKFNMYDEYFPLFRELLDQIMKTLEISRLDQIMPSIRALKILATPTLT